MKDCKKIHPLLSLYLDGSLSPREAAQVAAHLKDCADARRELEDLKRLREVMVALPEPKPPHDLHQRIMAKVQGRPLPLPRRPFWVFPAGAMAVAAVVAVFLVVQNPNLMNFSGQQENRSNPVPSITAAASKPGTQAVGHIQPQPKQTELNYQTYTYAPSQAQDSNFGLVKDQKAAPAPMSQFASMPRAKESRSAKKAMRMDLAMNKPVPAEQKSAEEANGAVAGSPSANLAFTGSTTLAQSPKNETFGATTSPSPSNANLPEAQASAPAPVAAAAPPAEAPAPVTSWSGSFNPTSSESQELVTDPAVFQKDWQAFQPGQAPPAVDFTAQAVVVLMDQERPTAGYSIHVTSLEDKPDQLVIHYQVQAPAPGSSSAQVLNRPWALQIIPKPTKPVVFQKD